MSRCVFMPVAKLVPIVRPRTALAGLVVLATLMTAHAGRVLAQCVVTVPNETCAGNVSGGIVAAPGVTTLNVNGLTAAIAPLHKNGIEFGSSTSASTIISDTGSFGITTDTIFDGIQSINSTNGVTVNSAGRITAGGDGIDAETHGAFNTGAVMVTSTSNITAGIDGIDAFSLTGNAGGAVTVISTGTITAGQDGIDAANLNAGAVTVTSQANITPGAPGALRGIDAESNVGTGNAGAVTVTSQADITPGGSPFQTGIFAHSASSGGNAGAVTVTSVGNITASTTGIDAHGDGAGGSAGPVTVSSSGTITAGNIGINASNNTTGNAGAVMVTSTGDISALGANSRGILAQSSSSGGTRGDLTVNILGGTVTGGSGFSGVGVNFVDGATNTLNNHGTILAASGTAVTGALGNETINNFGTIIGNVDLGAAPMPSTTRSAALFNSGADGQSRRRQHADQQRQPFSGRVRNRPDDQRSPAISFRPAPASSRSMRTGPRIRPISSTSVAPPQLAGTVVVNPMNFPTTAGLNQQFHILNATRQAASPITASRQLVRRLSPTSCCSRPVHDMYLTATINFPASGWRSQPEPDRDWPEPQCHSAGGRLAGNVCPHHGVDDAADPTEPRQRPRSAVARNLQLRLD